MTLGGRFSLLSGLAVLLALAGCGRSFMLQSQRPAWRHQAEVQCLRSGAVKVGVGVVEIKPIEGPGMCGADFPLKVMALGETNSRLGYSDTPRPPGIIGNSAEQPNWPPQDQFFDPAPAQGAPMRWSPGAPAIAPPRTTTPANYNSQPQQPAGQPVPLYPQNAGRPNDIPDDAILPRQSDQPRLMQPAYNAPVYEQRRQQEQPRYTPPALGPGRGLMPGGAVTQVELKPAATLACPIVSALDRWVSEGVQPAALHWFRSPVVVIKQIGAYSCREMVGAGVDHVSEHAFGNALDVAGFVLADGRSITVKDGWHGTPEEQGFLHDVQLYACETFVTVLAPGYNVFHYNHIHVDLMRRQNGRRPCRPTAIPGEVVAAKARAIYASRHNGGYTGSIPRKVADDKEPLAVPGADGLADDDEDTGVTGSISTSSDKTATAPDTVSKVDDDTTGSIGKPAPRLLPGSAGAIH
jgi:hypothetical protein